MDTETLIIFAWEITGRLLVKQSDAKSYLATLDKDKKLVLEEEAPLDNFGKFASTIQVTPVEISREQAVSIIESIERQDEKIIIGDQVFEK